MRFRTLPLLVVGCAALGTAASAQLRPPADSRPTVTAGVDAASGIRWTRIAVPASNAEGAVPQIGLWPTLIVECSQKGLRHSEELFFDFGNADAVFHPPDPLDPHASPDPTVKVTFSFQTFKPFLRQWQQMPSGELRYRNPGMSTSNLEFASFFLQYMYAVKETRVVYRTAQGDLTATFPTFDFVEAVRRTPLCQ